MLSVTNLDLYSTFPQQRSRKSSFSIKMLLLRIHEQHWGFGFGWQNVCSEAEVQLLKLSKLIIFMFVLSIIWVCNGSAQKVVEILVDSESSSLIPWNQHCTRGKIQESQFYRHPKACTLVTNHTAYLHNAGTEKSNRAMINKRYIVHP